jgi:hypothetical protein
MYTQTKGEKNTRQDANRRKALAFQAKFDAEQKAKGRSV